MFNKMVFDPSPKTSLNILVSLNSVSCERFEDNPRQVRREKPSDATLFLMQHHYYYRDYYYYVMTEKARLLLRSGHPVCIIEPLSFASKLLPSC